MENDVQLVVWNIQLVVWILRTLLVNKKQGEYGDIDKNTGKGTTQKYGWY